MGTESEGTTKRQPPRAFFDACVLVPISLTNTLMTLAEARRLNPQWSPVVLDEVSRSLRGLYPDASVQPRIHHMNRSFPDANIVGGQHLVDQLSLPDPNDRHVVASAIHGGAEVIVTSNLKDFPAKSLPAGLTVQHPDDFLLRQFGEAPEITVAVLHEIAQGSKRPPITTEEHLGALAKSGAPRFAQTAGGKLGLATRTLGPEFDGASRLERIMARLESRSSDSRSSDSRSKLAPPGPSRSRGREL